jgi:hypothetical protein
MGIRNTFQGQYILMETICSQSKTARNPFTQSVLNPNFITQLHTNKRIYCAFIKKSKNICIWGASGKGVIFLSELNEEALKKIKYVVDINPKKQGRFLPLSAKIIVPPEALKKINEEFVVLPMNRIYEKEIRNNLDRIKVKAQVCIV